MPPTTPAPVGAPIWVDLMTSDPARSIAFYGDLFGWEAEEPNPDLGGYSNFTKDGARIAGCMLNHTEPRTPDVWSVYLCSAGRVAPVHSAAFRSISSSCFGDRPSAVRAAGTSPASLISASTSSVRTGVSPGALSAARSSGAPSPPVCLVSEGGSRTSTVTPPAR